MKKRDDIYYSGGMEKAVLREGNPNMVASAYGKTMAEQNRDPYPTVKKISVSYKGSAKK